MMAAVANTMRGAPGAETGGDGIRAPRGGSTGGSPLSALADLGDALDFYQCATRQSPDSDGRARRVRRRHVTVIDLVDLGRVGDVREEDGRLQDLREIGPGGIQDGFDVAQGLFGLSCGAPLDQPARAWVAAQLAGGEDQVAAHDRLAVWTDDSWRRVRL